MWDSAAIERLLDRAQAAEAEAEAEEGEEGENDNEFMAGFKARTRIYF